MQTRTFSKTQSKAIGLRLMMTDVCTVVTRAVSQFGKTTTTTETTYPCRISFGAPAPAAGSVQNDDSRTRMGALRMGANHLTQEVKLFLPPNAEILPGASVSVKRGDHIYPLCRAGHTNHYPTHCVVSLTTEAIWA